MKDGKQMVTDLAEPTTKMSAKRDAVENETKSPGRVLERPKIRRSRFYRREW